MSDPSATACHGCQEWAWPNIDVDLARFAACCHVALVHPADYHADTGRDVEQVVAEATAALDSSGITPHDLHLVGRAFHALSEGNPAGAAGELQGATPEARALMADLVGSMVANEDHPA